MNLIEIMRQQAQARGDEPAIIQMRRGRRCVVSFNDLHSAGRRSARLLCDRGLKRGDAALILQPMSIELYTALLGLFQIGAVAMFLDPSAGFAHIEQCCSIGQPKALIAGPKAHLMRLRSRGIRAIERKFVIGLPLPGAVRWTSANMCDPLEEVAAIDDDAPALLTFTSGSTGKPKAAVRTHGFLRAQHRALESSLHLQAGQVDLTTLPVFLLANLASGVTSVIPDADLRAPGAIKAEPVIRQIAREGVQSTVASPAFLLRLAAQRESPGVTLPGMQRIFTGGAPVFPEALARLSRMAPRARVIALYGSTEAEPIAHIEHAEIDEVDHAAMRVGAGLIAGRPVSSIQLRIIPDQWDRPIGPYAVDEFEAHCVQADEPGEIVVSGEHVLRGYLHGHGDEETKFRVGERIWHRTGDAGRLDSRGRLWLLGRCTARIDDEHGTIYPFGVECAARAILGDARCAFIQLEGVRTLIVERGNGERVQELRAALEWSHVRDVIEVDCIPMDKRHNAKIDYPALRTMFEEKQSRPS